MIDRFDKQYPVEDVFAFVQENNGHSKKEGKKRVEFDGHLMKPYSLRYLTFMNSGTKCVCCGIEGTHFYKERSLGKNGKVSTHSEYGNYHFNLYGVNEHGHEVLITKDHIVAKYHGGKDVVDNMQTMCTKCNGIKSSMTTEQWEEYQKTCVLPDDYHKQVADPNSKRQKKKANKKKIDEEYGYSPERYAMLKTVADKYGKDVYIYPTLNNRLAIAKDQQNADKKFTGHKAVLYKED